MFFLSTLLPLYHVFAQFLLLRQLHPRFFVSSISVRSCTRSHLLSSLLAFPSIPFPLNSDASWGNEIPYALPLVSHLSYRTISCNLNGSSVIGGRVVSGGSWADLVISWGEGGDGPM